MNYRYIQNIDEAHKNAEQKKPVTKKFMLHDLIYMMF